MLLGCTNGYILRDSFFPFHPSCVPDLVKYANVEKLRGEMSQLLGAHAGGVECGDVVEETFLPETEVRKRLMKMHVCQLAW